MVKTLFLDLPIITFSSTLAHEYYGHGAKGRDFNLKLDYGYGFPAPYNLLRENQSFGWTSYDGNLSLNESAQFNLAGFDANYLFADYLLMENLQHTHLHRNDLNTYFINRLTLTGYGFLNRNSETGSDIQGYLDDTRLVENKTSLKLPGAGKNRKKELALLSLLNFLDPVWLMNIYWNFDYFFNRNKAYAYDYYLLPRFNYGLYPFGDYLGFDLFGTRHFPLIKKAGIKIIRLEKWNSFYADGEYKILNFGKYLLEGTTGIGKYDSVKDSFAPVTLYPLLQFLTLSDNYKENFWLKISAGYKSEGYIAGYPFNSSFLMLISLYYTFDGDLNKLDWYE